MVDITFREYFEFPLDVLLPPTIAPMVSGAIDALCAMHYAAPAETAGLIGLTNAPSPTAGTLVPRLCPTPPPTQPSPNVPFSGGQSCRSYDVTIVGTVEGNTSTLQFRLPGKIRGLVYEESAGAPNRYSGSYVIEYGHDCPGVTPGRLALFGGQNMLTKPSGFISAVVPVGAEPDTGGNPVPVYPPSNQPPEFFQPEIEVEIGGDTYNFPLTFSPTTTSPDYPSRPQINFNIGDQLSVNITGEGFTFGNPPSRTPPPGAVPNPLTPGDRLPPSTPQPLIQPRPFFPVDVPNYGNNGGGTVVCPDLDLQPVLAAVANVDADLALVAGNVELLLDCDRCKRLVPEDCNRVLMGSGQSLIKPLNASVQWIEIELTTIPVNAKTQWGVDAPDVYYAGWYSIGSFGCGGDRKPVHYQRNIYPMLEGARLFSYTLTSGYSANIWMYFAPAE